MSTCSKHVEACNKLIIKQDFVHCSLITKITKKNVSTLCRMVARCTFTVKMYKVQKAKANKAQKWLKIGFQIHSQSQNVTINVALAK